MNAHAANLNSSLYLVVFIILGACNNRDKDETSKDSNPEHTLPENKPIKVKVNAWSELNDDVFQTSRPIFYMPPVKSFDNKWLYLATSGYGGNLRVIALTSDFTKDVTSKTNWKKISLENPSFNDLAGQAKLKDNGNIRAINSIKEGMVLAWQGNSLRNGAVIFKGDQLFKAFKDSSLHIRGFNKGLQISNFFAVDKNGAEIPYVANNANRILTTGASLNDLNVTTNPSTHNFSTAKFVQDANTAFLIDSTGISMLDKAQAGTNQKFSDVNQNTAIYGAKEWKFSGGGNDNDDVQAALIAKGILYIGLSAPGSNPDRGGVALYNIAKKVITAPKQSIWSGIGIVQLITDKNDAVWAVTGNALYAIKDDGTIEHELNAKTVKDNQAKRANAQTAVLKYTGEMPQDSIMGATFVGETLFLTTVKKVYLMTPETIELR